MVAAQEADSVAAERIRHAAIEAFAESGFGGSSTRQITKRLNMSATAMYPHYRSKEELLFAIALEGHHGLLAALRKADKPNATFVVRLQAVVAAFAAWHAEHHKQARVIQYELHGLTSTHYRTIAALRRETTGIIAEIVRNGVAAEEFGVTNTDDVVLAISSLCVDVCRWFPSRKHRDPQRLGQLYARLAEKLVH